MIGAGAAVGGAVWLVALQLYRRMAETPKVETIETPVAGKSPAEAIKAVAENAARLVGQAKLARPAEHVFEVAQFDCQARIEAHRAGGQTMLTAELDDAKLRRKFQWILALFVVLLMPCAIVGIAAGLWYFAAPHPSPGARWQSVQVVQMIHVLWPPFLMYFLWKKQRTAAFDAMSNLLVLSNV